MTVVATQLHDELGRLRKGRGLYIADIRPESIPGLSEVFDITPEDTGPEVRRKLAEGLDSLAAALPDDLALTARASLGLNAETKNLPLLTARIEWLEGTLNRSSRTLHRRIEDASRRLADLAVHRFDTDGPSALGDEDGWYVDTLSALMRLDTDTPEVTEERTIVALVDGLSEIAAPVTVPRDAAVQDGQQSLMTELTYGGALTTEEIQGYSHFKRMISLPGPLQTGDRHEFGLRMHIPEGQKMAPYYVCVPFRRYDHLRLRVRFDPNRPPRRVWRVVGLPPQVFQDGLPTSDLVQPNRFGDVYFEAHNLRQGMGYGIQWEE